jgi:predicted GH43/DUF377 family glycosyl hydrolase
MMPMYYETLLKRHADNPIIAPGDFPYGRADAVFNCGQTMFEDRTVLLLAVLPADGSPAIYVAESADGTHFTIRPEPFMTQTEEPRLAPYDKWVIDTRVTRIEEAYYIVRPTGSTAHALLYRTRDFETCEFLDCIALGHNRVPCLFPRRVGGYYWKLDRPSLGRPPDNPGSIWISRSPDLIHWGHFRPLQEPFIHWAGFKIGPTPPIWTEKGWLEIIHGVQKNCSTSRYSLGALLLDLEDPTRVKGRMNGYLLTPETDYEQCGRVPDVVFTCGAIADADQDRLRVYYGAADTCIGLAEGRLSEIVAACVGEGG